MLNNKTFTRRLFVILLLKITLFLTILIRLFFLQIKDNQYFNYLSNRNRTSKIPIIPKRGIIFDTFKVPIASNILVWQALFIKSSLTSSIDIFLNKFSKIISLSKEEKNEIIKQYNKSYTYDATVIKNSLTTEDIATLETYHTLLPEVFISAAYNRRYLYPEQTAHIIGYIAQSSDKSLTKGSYNWHLGKQGLELSLDSILKGSLGYREYEINAQGKVQKKIGTIASSPGHNISITIDIELQNFIYGLIKDLSASCVVLDVETGEILSCVSTPSFDSNQLSYGISSREWNNIIGNNENPLNNRAVAGLYPPASTMKPFVALAALERNLIDSKTKYTCNGYLDIGNRRFHCWKRTGHGEVNIHTAIENSCDIFFYNIGIKMQRSDFRDLGFNIQLLNNLLPLIPNCAKGNLPLRAEKSSLGDLAIASIGQGEWLVTPLHIANMGSILANNGAIKEIKLLKQMEYTNKVIYSRPNKILGYLPFSEKNITIVKEALANVLKAYNAESLWPMSAKTGTAQVVQITQEQRLKGTTRSSIRKYREHALFMGYMPSYNPKYSIGLVIEHAGFSSHSAVPIANRISEALYKRHPFYEEEKNKLKGILERDE